MPINPPAPPPTTQEKAQAAITEVVRRVTHDPTIRVVVLILLGFVLGRV